MVAKHLSLIGMTGRCKKYDRLVQDWDGTCIGTLFLEELRTGKKTSYADFCGKCKYYKPVAEQLKLKPFGGLEARCIFECEHYAGFYNDHTRYICCQVYGTTINVLGDPECACFKQKEKDVSNKTRFETIEIED